MRILFVIIMFCCSLHAQQHCGYDFTSYVVLHIHEDGQKDNIGDLRVTLVDADGREVVNTNNQFSWTNRDEPLYFTRNYMIGDRWYFPYAKDTYLLSVTNTFPADEFQVRISDARAVPVYESTTIPLYVFNMFVLCSSEQQQKAMQFGRRVNKPVDVVLARVK